MEGGVAVVGSGAEVNLDWQVLFRVHLMKPFSPYSLLVYLKVFYNLF